MELSSFLALKKEEVAQLVRADGPKVCVCPINGTRRWYFLEHVTQTTRVAETNYLEVVLDKYVEIFNLFFDFGIDTLLTPIFGPDLLSRGDDYLALAIQGMAAMVTNDKLLNFVHQNQVRVRFYGDYVRYFRGTQYAYLLDLFENLTAQTRPYTRHRLFWGVVGNDATEQVAEFGARFFAQHARYPSRKEIVEAYYGEYVSPVSLFVGFDKFSAFDMPLLATGNEDLYFTTTPTPYLTEHQLRLILFDHLFERKGEPDYANLTQETWERMRSFYRANQDKTQGVGVKIDGVWYPLSQVINSDNFCSQGTLK
ncbi:MAG: diterpene synthase [Anaerolineales bacterium]